MGGRAGSGGVVVSGGILTLRIAVPETATFDDALTFVRTESESLLRTHFSARAPADDGPALRSVARALAAHVHALDIDSSSDDLHERLAVALEVVLGLPQQSDWADIEAALTALAGGVE